MSINKTIIPSVGFAVRGAVISSGGASASTFSFLDADDTAYAAPLTFLDADDTSYSIPATFLDADDTSYSL